MERRVLTTPCSWPGHAPSVPAPPGAHAPLQGQGQGQGQGRGRAWCSASRPPAQPKIPTTNAAVPRAGWGCRCRPPLAPVRTYCPSRRRCPRRTSSCAHPRPHRPRAAVVIVVIRPRPRGGGAGKRRASSLRVRHWVGFSVGTREAGQVHRQGWARKGRGWARPLGFSTDQELAHQPATG